MVRVGFDEFRAFARVLFEVAAVLELRAHVAGHGAVAAAFAEAAWFAGLFGALAFLGGGAGGGGVGVVEGGGWVVHFEKGWMVTCPGDRRECFELSFVPFRLECWGGRGSGGVYVELTRWSEV